MTESNIFRVFVSSTFSDMAEERNALHERVFPRLHELCTSYGARFQPIDLRWGISDEAALNQQTVAICLAEIARCQQMTRRPNFIVLLGDRYGWQPSPADIPCDEFEIILAHTPDSADQELLNEWYRRDNNAVPPVYNLQPRTGSFTDSAIWNPIERQLRRIVETAASYLPEDRRAKYLTSVTEQEIKRGILAVEDPIASAFCFIRTITDLPAHPDARRYIDLDENVQLDTVAQARLHDLKQRLRDRLSDNIHEYEARWEAGKVSTAHLDQLCEDVYERLAAVIRSELETRQSYTNPWEDEFTAHLDFGQDRARSFVGRGDVIERIGAYLAQPTGKPLVVYGESGSGKTTVMGRVMQQVQADYPQAVLICRFIGVTPGSSDIRSLLESLYRQIQWRTGASVAIPTDYHELISTFATLLTQANAERPLIVLLDALDQLSTLNEAHKLAWLPVELPDHVRLICSTLPGDSLDVLREKLDSDNLVEVGPLSVADGRSLLRTWLSDAGRTLQPPQEAEVLHHFETNGRPLYLRLAFEEVRLWKSYTTEFTLSSGIPGIIRDNLFARLASEANHGPRLVSHALAYLVVARNGLTEDELLDLLARDDEFWTDFTADAYWNPIGRQVPVVIWSRLYFDLRPYLNERAGDGTALMAFYHRQLREAAESCYLSDPIGAQFHRRMAQYFGEQALYLNQNGAHVPNQRKLSELPNQHFHGGQMQELCALLTDSPEWMEAQFAVSNGDVAYTADLVLALSGFADPLESEQLSFLTKLHTVRQIVHSRTDAWVDLDLETLVWLGRAQEAKNQARLRPEPHERCEGLMIVYDTQKQATYIDIALLNECILPASNIRNKDKRVKALSRLATAFAQVGEAARAQEIVAKIDDGTARASALGALAKIQSQAGEPTHAKQAVDAALDICEDRYGRQSSELNERSGDLTQTGESGRARIVANSIQPEDKEAEALRPVAALIKTGDFQQAFEMSLGIQTDWRQASALTILASALSGAGEAVRAPEAFNAHWTSSSNATHAIPPQGKIKGRSSKNRFPQIFFSLQRRLGFLKYILGMSNAASGGISDESKPERNLGGLASIPTQANEMIGALEVFRMTRMTINDIRNASKKTKAWSELVTALVQVGEYEQACTIIENISPEHSKAIVLGNLALVLAQMGDTARAEEALSMARALRLKESWDRKPNALGALAIALVKTGNQKLARVLVENIQDKKVRAQALGDLTLTLSQIGEYDLACEISDRIEDEVTRLAILRNLATAMVRTGETVRVKEILNAIYEVVDGSKNKDKQSFAKRSLAAILALVGQYEKAQKVAESLEPYDQAVALSAIASALTNVGESTPALRIFTAARETTRNIKFEVFRAAALGALAEHLAEAGEAAYALEVINEAINAAENLEDDRKRGREICDLAVVKVAILVQMGEYEQAFSVAQNIHIQEKRVSALSDLAVTLKLANEVRRSQEVFNVAHEAVHNIEDGSLSIEVGVYTPVFSRGHAKDYGSRAFAMRKLATALAHAGDFVEAFGVLGVRDPDEFIEIVSLWNLPPMALHEIVRIIGWVRPDWREIHKLLITGNQGVADSNLDH